MNPLFRVVQEALANIHRHSGAESACVRLEIDGEDIVLAVKDKGKGMSDEQMKQLAAGTNRLGVGLTGMQERIREYNGLFHVESSLAGTKIVARMRRLDREREKIKP